MFWTIKLHSLLAIILVGILIVTGGIFLYRPVKTTFSEQKEVELPILMYHHILKDSSRWGKYVIGPKELEQDLIYLKEQGYETVTAEDVIQFVYHNTPLPEKPIMLTFDDGYYSNFVYAEQLLEQYEMKGVLFIIGKYTDDYSKSGEENTNYSHVTWQHCRDMKKRGIMELQNHTYEMHSFSATRQGSSKQKTETLWQYHFALSKDLKQLQDQFQKETGYVPRAFAYPFGIVSPESVDVLKELGFLVAVTCNEGVNHLSTGSTEELYHLKRILRPSGTSAQSILEAMQ